MTENSEVTCEMASVLLILFLVNEVKKEDGLKCGTSAVIYDGNKTSSNAGFVTGSINFHRQCSA